MKRLLMAVALMLPLCALVAQAQEAKPAKKAAPAAAKAGDPAKPADTAKPAKPADQAKPEADTAEAAPTCNYDQQIELFKEMRDMHKAAAAELKTDPVSKALKAGKDKKLAMAYDKQAKAEKKFHDAMAKALDAQIKELEKLNTAKSPRLCEMLANAPDDAKAALKERDKKMGDSMKAQAAKMAARADTMVAQ
ncbi:MAG: hypothetical protein JXR83_03690 [Deltaproteobacteria bacterium]|nr:hypothetical protein [Deltaproteobacteria bacterium]